MLLAQTEAVTQMAPAGLAYLAGGFGSSVIIVGASYGLSKLSSHASESIARQPQAAQSMFLTWLLPAAMLEGATLFALVNCILLCLKT